MKKSTAIVAAALIVSLLAPIHSAQAVKPGPNLVQTAIAVNSEGPFAGQFDTLIAALQAADASVLATLTGRGKVTVFAPTDGAFELLGLTATNITDVDRDFLTDVLFYHLAPGKRNAKNVLKQKRIRTLFGDFLYQEGGVLTDQVSRTANIIVTDVPASNGIIHAIDAVVLPYAP